MRPLVRFLIAVVMLGALPGAYAQGVLFPNPHPRFPFPRPIPGPHPLKVELLRVDTHIEGQVATTRVTQVFHNDLDFVVDGLIFQLDRRFWCPFHDILRRIFPVAK